MCLGKLTGLLAKRGPWCFIPNTNPSPLADPGMCLIAGQPRWKGSICWLNYTLPVWGVEREGVCVCVYVCTCVCVRVVICMDVDAFTYTCTNRSKAFLNCLSPRQRHPNNISRPDMTQDQLFQAGKKTQKVRAFGNMAVFLCFASICLLPWVCQALPIPRTMPRCGLYTGLPECGRVSLWSPNHPLCHLCQGQGRNSEVCVRVVLHFLVPGLEASFRPL